MTHNMLTNRNDSQASQANKSAAAVLKERLKAPASSDSTSNSGSGHDGDSNGAGTTTAPSNINGTTLATPAKRKADVLDDDSTDTPDKAKESPVQQDEPVKDADEPPEDTVRLWEEGYSDRYYEQKFGVEASDLEFRHKVARAYVEGLAWVLLYYFQGCPSWTWYYRKIHEDHFASAIKFADLSESLPLCAFRCRFCQPCQREDQVR